MYYNIDLIWKQDTAIKKKASEEELERHLWRSEENEDNSPRASYQMLVISQLPCAKQICISITWKD